MTTARTATAALLVPLVLLTAPAAAASSTDVEPEGDAPYYQTPPKVVQRMLTMAGVDRDAIVYDLGSGDGRIPITAVREFDARKAVGVELDADLVEESRANAEEAGVAERTRFIEGDLFEVDFSDADIVTLYLLPQTNVDLRPVLLSQLEPGARVVSHHFAMGEWQPDAQDIVGNSQIFMWTVPAEVAGTWRWRADGEEYRLDLRQRFQEVRGEVHMGERMARVTGGTIEGARLRFQTCVPGGSGEGGLDFDGRVDGQRIRASVSVDGRATDIVATRAD